MRVAPDSFRLYPEKKIRLGTQLMRLEIWPRNIDMTLDE